jgi:hypothetical protein
MSQPVLTQSRLQAGVWHCVIEAQSAPDLVASLEGRVLPGLTCRAGQAAGSWRINLPLPSEILSEGLQTIVLRMPDGTTIGSLAILSGEALADDLRAEIALLRSELDILKAAFRRQHQRR